MIPKVDMSYKRSFFTQ